MHRVAGLVPDGALTCAVFDHHAKVNSSTVKRRFGGWQTALEAAGLGDRYAGKRVTPKMLKQTGRVTSREDMIAELRRVANELGTNSLTRDDFNRLSATLADKAIRSRFGSWGEGLKAAGLELTPLGRRHSQDDYFENLLAVWTHYGRAPHYAEMDQPPSAITGGAYVHKWGTWSKARLAFLEAVNGPEGADQTGTEGPVRTPAIGRAPLPTALSVGLRYRVFRRDRFRCVLCGASPATDLRCVLHADHIMPVTRGGLSTLENLRTLCQDCNLGKGSRLEGN
jgi:hypothetical protein